MHYGPFAMIDALGFKGIWNRHSGDVVLGELQRLLNSTEEILNLHRSSVPGFEKAMFETGTLAALSKASFLSDTIVLGMEGRSQQLHDPASGLPLNMARARRAWTRYIAGTLARVMKIAAEGPLALAYRGAVSYGEFVMSDDGRFIVGAAVDEARQHADLAQLSFPRSKS